MRPYFMNKNMIRDLMKSLLTYIAVILSTYTVFLSSVMAGGLEPLPDLQKAVEEVRFLYIGEDLSFLADKEYQVRKYYYQIQSKTEKLEILKEVKGHFEKAVSKAEEKFDSGEEDVSQSAITKLKLGLAGTLNDIIELESEVKVAQLSLALIFKDNYSIDGEMPNPDKWFKVSGLVFGIDSKGTTGKHFPSNELALKTGYLKAVETRKKLNLARENRKITLALLVSEVANYDFGIGDPEELFEALIIYTRVLSGYYDSVYNFNLAVADLNRVKASWTGKP